MITIKEVKPLEDYKLLIIFENNQKKIKDKKFFNKVKIAYGTINWDDELDLCADSIYKSSYVYKKNK